MKNAFEGFISRLDMAKETFSELEDFSIETSKTEKKKKLKKENKIQELQKAKSNNVRRIGISEQEERKEQKNI